MKTAAAAAVWIWVVYSRRNATAHRSIGGWSDRWHSEASWQ